jgi:hypothetical protein
LASAAGLSGSCLVERRTVGFDTAERDQAHAEFTVELGSESHDAAPVGIAPGRLGGRIGVGDVLGDEAHRPACARMPLAAMAIDLMKSITARPLLPPERVFRICRALS